MHQKQHKNCKKTLEKLIYEGKVLMNSERVSIQPIQRYRELAAN